MRSPGSNTRVHKVAAHSCSEVGVICFLAVLCCLFTWLMSVSTWSCANKCRCHSFDVTLSSSFSFLSFSFLLSILLFLPHSLVNFFLSFFFLPYFFLIIISLLFLFSSIVSPTFFSSTLLPSVFFLASLCLSFLHFLFPLYPLSAFQFPHLLCHVYDTVIWTVRREGLDLHS